MKKCYPIILVIYLLFSCSNNVIEPESLKFDGESYPVGPLKIINSKIKTETGYQMNTSRIIQRIEYEYYPNGLLKSKKLTYPGQTFDKIHHYYYDHAENLIIEIILEGSVSSDTIFSRYDPLNKLIQKETIRSSSSFAYRDTVFYQYDQEGKLIEWNKKDPYSQFKTIHREKYEYTAGLLSKVYFYENERVIHTFEYRYYNGILTKKLEYAGSGLLSHTLIYYYHDGLLRNVKGYYEGLTGKREEIVYQYNNQFELIIQKVYVPAYSSSVDHEIHYEYY